MALQLPSNDPGRHNLEIQEPLDFGGVVEQPGDGRTVQGLQGLDDQALGWKSPYRHDPPGGESDGPKDPVARDNGTMVSDENFSGGPPVEQWIEWTEESRRGSVQLAEVARSANKGAADLAQLVSEHLEADPSISERDARPFGQVVW
jgi:hypothetical protein